MFSVRISTVRGVKCLRSRPDGSLCQHAGECVLDLADTGGALVCQSLLSAVLLLRLLLSHLDKDQLIDHQRC